MLSLASYVLSGPGFAVIVPLKHLKGERQMKAPIREILQYALDRPDLTTKEAVFSYFSEDSVVCGKGRVGSADTRS